MTAATLSVHRAFVVQFREGPAPSRRWQGRVEHIAPGQAATFSSRAELLAFLASHPAARPTATQTPGLPPLASSVKTPPTNPAHPRPAPGAVPGQVTRHPEKRRDP